jgi:aminopeptidase N
VIRMMEAYVGEDAFRDGVRAYMARYARSNTVSADLWRELESTSQAPIGAIAGDFTRQAGVPMIDVNEADGSVTLSQDRFGIDPASREARTWRVPVVASPVASPVATPGASPAVATPAGSPAAGADRDARRLIVSGPQRVALPNAPAWLVNAGQTGYFVSRYSPELLRRLLDRIPQLSAEDQLGLFGDTAALASAGYSPMASLLDLVAAVPVDIDPAVWSRVCDELVTLGRHYEEGARAQAYRRWVRAELAPVLARVGWDRHAGESDSTTALRPVLLKALAEADDPAVITEARNRFDRFEQSAQTLAGDLRSAVLSIVALHADAAAWERLHAIAQGQKAALERDQAYQILGGTRDPVLARRALELALSAETPRTSAPDLLRAVSVRHASDAFDFVASHWARIAPLLVPQYSSGFAPRIAAASDDPATTARLSEFAGRVGRSCDPGEVRRAIAGIRYRASIKQQRLAEIDRWLGDHS